MLAKQCPNENAAEVVGHHHGTLDDRGRGVFDLGLPTVSTVRAARLYAGPSGLLTNGSAAAVRARITRDELEDAARDDRLLRGRGRARSRAFHRLDHDRPQWLHRGQVLSQS